MERKVGKFTSPDVQNKLLKIMAVSILRDIAAKLSNSVFFTLMADEVTDVSNKEQVAVCLRSTNENFGVHEDFIGLHVVESIEADVLVSVLKDVLLWLNLSINNCRGQCYDGAANMAGARTGVATQITREEPKAIYTHCYGHALNLAASDAIKKNKVLRDAMDTTQVISKLLKYSPRRDALFEKIKEELAPATPGFRTLCPMRWTVQACFLQSVIDSYAVFQELWDEALDIVHDCDTHAQIDGVKASMKTFHYLFGLVLGQCLLRHADNLSKTLQSPTLTASEAQQIAELTCKTLLCIRDEESFELLWKSVILLQESNDINEAELPRKRKAPARFQAGSRGYHSHTPKDLYRPMYLECVDHIVNCVRMHFDQPGYAVLMRLENLLLNAAKNQPYDEDLAFVLQHYGSDFNAVSLKTQLQLFTTTMAEGFDVSVSSIRSYFQSLSPMSRGNIFEVGTLLKLILVVPATNVISERSASALRRVKTYLRSTMSQARLSYLLILHCHKERTEDHSLVSCLCEFVECRERRAEILGKF